MVAYLEQEERDGFAGRHGKSCFASFPIGGEQSVNTRDAKQLWSCGGRGGGRLIKDGARKIREVENREEMEGEEDGRRDREDREERVEENGQWEE